MAAIGVHDTNHTVSGSAGTASSVGNSGIGITGSAGTAAMCVWVGLCMY